MIDATQSAAGIPVAGLLLAAGQGTRFGGGKLAVPIPIQGGERLAIGVAALRNLAAVLPGPVVVVHGGDPLVADYRQEGARVVVAERAARGMGASLAEGIASLPRGSGVVVALADMPWIRQATIRLVADAVARGALIAAPYYRGERGHPVGFAPAFRRELESLDHDQGARAVMAARRDAIVVIDVDDPDVLRDVDTPADLR